MIDLILLFFLCRRIGATAARKGLKPWLWNLYTVLAWFLFEFVGFNIALAWLGYTSVQTPEQLLRILAQHPSLFLFSLFCAFGGYLLVRYRLEHRPDPPAA